jgi:hypothetical protein
MAGNSKTPGRSVISKVSAILPEHPAPEDVPVKVAKDPVATARGLLGDGSDIED